MLRSILAVVASLLVAGNLAPGRGGSELTGVVKDLSAAPIAGVLLTLGSLDRALQTRSGKDGRFRFENIPNGKYDLELAASGFVTQSFPVDVSGITLQPLTITLRLLESLPDVSYCGPHPLVSYSLLQADNPHLTGVVRDYSDGKPLRNATVSLWRNGEEHPAFASHSDQVGEFKFNDLPAGHYDLRILRRGYRAAELKQLLVPGESGTSVDFSVLKQKWLVACE